MKNKMKMKNINLHAENIEGKHFVVFSIFPNAEMWILPVEKIS